jgi:hypothetical protein
LQEHRHFRLSLDEHDNTDAEDEDVYENEVTLLLCGTSNPCFHQDIWDTGYSGTIIFLD